MARWTIGGVLVLVLVAGIIFSLRSRQSIPTASTFALQAEPLYSKKSGQVAQDHPEAFAEYHALIRQRLDAPHLHYEPGYQRKALNAAEAASKTAFGMLGWQERGPGNVGGRTRALIIDPQDPTHRTWYAGSVGGGVWKTLNGGGSWQNLTPNLPNLAVTALAQSASNPDILYVGTGEGFGNFGAITGGGIWKSTDRGATWNLLEQTALLTQFRSINRLLVHPTNPNIVVAATNGGMQYSSDGGQYWTPTYAWKSEQVLARPNQFDTLYATANGLGVLMSTDGGQHWEHMFNLRQQGTRMELAMAPSSPRRLYLAVYRSPRSVLYLSDNAGLTWDEVVEEIGEGPAWLGGQGWYDNTLTVHPYNKDILYVGGIDVWKMQITRLVGNRWIRNTTQATYWVPQESRPANDPRINIPYVHADHHNLIAIPIDKATGTFHLLSANDGGVSLSTNSGLTWRAAQTGYNTAQFYGADKRPGADEYFGGMQDNGTWRSPRSGNATAPWVEQLSGDGFEVAWHAQDPLKLMGTIQYNSFWRSLDGGQTWREANEGMYDTGPGQGNFFTTLAKSQSDPDLVIATGVNGVWRSDSFGARWGRSRMNASHFWRFAGSLRTPAAISIADPQIMWAGATMSPDHRLFVSTDGGVSFSPASRHPDANAFISGLATHPTDSKTAYALFSAINHPKILRTRDLGVTWEDLTGGAFDPNTHLSSNGYPNVATYSLLVMPYNPNEIWAGTEIGIFRSTNGGQTWSKANDDLPAVSVWNMRIVDDQVVIATHGRGVWSVTLPELANYRPPVVTRAPRLEASQRPDGTLALFLGARSAYDSLHVVLENQVIKRMTKPIAIKDTLLVVPFPVETPRLLTVNVVAFRKGRSYPSIFNGVTLLPLAPRRKFYRATFEQTSSDFFENGLSVRSVAGFSGGAIHSDHPYGDQRTFSIQLSIPIEVAAEKAIIRYKDVAIVEIGEPGTRFGDPEFWDYVVVEGSKDGLNWIPLADGYDASAFPAWREAYEQKQDGTEAMFQEHVLDLHHKFAPGDVIFLRFRLYADPAVHGWGWVIDDLVIQETYEGVAVEDEATVPERFTLEPNYPNPFNPTTTIPFSLSQPARVSLTVYDLQGRQVAVLAEGFFGAGAHQVRWDARQMASGVYVVRLQGGRVNQSRMMVLAK